MSPPQAWPPQEERAQSKRLASSPRHSAPPSTKCGGRGGEGAPEMFEGGEEES